MTAAVSQDRRVTVLYQGHKPPEITDGSRLCWALPSPVHERSGYRASRPTGYKVMRSFRIVAHGPVLASRLACHRDPARCGRAIIAPSSLRPRPLTRRLRRSREIIISAGLASASGGRDHTILRPHRRRSSARMIVRVAKASTASRAPPVVTIGRNARLQARRDADTILLIFRTCQVIYFCAESLDRTLQMRRDLPVETGQE